MSTKQILRTQIGQLLGQVDLHQLISQSESAAKVLRSLPIYQQSTSIAFYMHMESSELQTTKMIENAFCDSKRVFLPQIAPYDPGEMHGWFPKQKTHLRMLEMQNIDSVNDLKPRGKYKLREPTEGFDCLGVNGSGLDLIVLPGVAFSRCGGRLGHGAGFYDSFISEHEKKIGRTPKLVGVGLIEQLVEPSSRLPLDPHDRILDYLILGDTVIWSH